MKYDADYRETVVLDDGSRVTLRLVRPEDKDLLRRGFERLSPESRYRRFLGPKVQLLDAELAYLTEVDGWNHFAIGALDGAGEGVAIARFIRSASDPKSAEVAVAVVDDWQRKGLGTLLLLRLVAAARERDIERFAGMAHAANAAVHDVLAQLPGGARLGTSGDQLTFEVDLAAVPAGEDPHLSPLRRFLAVVARGLLLVRKAVS